MTDQKTLFLLVSKVDGPVFEDRAISVHVPGVDGEMEIFANHEAIISPLKAGEVTITKVDGTKDVHLIDSGTLEVSNNRATILV